MSKHHGHGPKHGAGTQVAGAPDTVPAPDGAHDDARAHSAIEATATPEAGTPAPAPIEVIERLVAAEARAEKVTDQYVPAFRTWIVQYPVLAVGVAFAAGFVAMGILRR